MTSQPNSLHLHNCNREEEFQRNFILCKTETREIRSKKYLFGDCFHTTKCSMWSVSLCSTKPYHAILDSVSKYVWARLRRSGGFSCSHLPLGLRGWGQYPTPCLDRLVQWKMTKMVQNVSAHHRDAILFDYMMIFKHFVPGISSRLLSLLGTPMINTP